MVYGRHLYLLPRRTVECCAEYHTAIVSSVRVSRLKDADDIMAGGSDTRHESRI